MKTTNEHTTMICLFHSPNQADAAVSDLVRAGIPKDSIGLMGNSGTTSANPVAMEKWKVPERDSRLLTDGINKGGVVVAVSADHATADQVESIFTRHQASQVDEMVAASSQVATAKPAVSTKANAGGKIEVIEEEMTVGKRQVERGGVRVYQRILETPVSETVNLNEERINVERHAVDRPVTAADTAAFKDQAFEMRATGEEAVVSKKARVVEEVVVGKESSEHTETVKGTVRKTDVKVEKLETDTNKRKTRSN